MNEPPNNLSFRRIRFKLETAGFTEIRQLNNHAKFVRKRGDSVQTAILPHYQEISTAVFRSVLKQAGLSQAEFDKL